MLKLTKQNVDVSALHAGNNTPGIVEILRCMYCRGEVAFGFAVVRN
jgi:hypothetical protein